jgi:hypothetical protein
MKFVFEVTDVNRELLIKAPYAALDGNLTIDINHWLFFDKECVSLLELAIHVTGWLSGVKEGIYSDFDYSADDYEENPVLHFTKNDNQHYTISSAWVNTETEIRLEVAEIIQCFNDFLQELDSTVQQAYGIAFTDIPLLKPIDKPKGLILKKLLQRFWS